MIKVRVVKFHKVSTLICASIALALPLSAARAQMTYPGEVQSACSDLGVTISAPACTYCHTDGGFNGATALSKADAMALLCPNLPVSQTDTGTTSGTGTTTTDTGTTTTDTGTTTTDTGTTTTDTGTTTTDTGTDMTTVSGSDEDGETESTETGGRMNFGSHDGIATADQPPMNPTAAAHSQRSYHRVDVTDQVASSGDSTSGDTTKGRKRHGKHARD